MVSAAPGTSRGGSISSMRTSHLPGVREPAGSCRERQLTSRNVIHRRGWREAPDIVRFRHINSNKAERLPPLEWVNRTGINPPSVFADFCQRFTVDAQIGGRTRFRDECQFQHHRIRSSQNLRPRPSSAFFDLLISLRSRSRLRSSRLNSSS